MSKRKPILDLLIPLILSLLLGLVCFVYIRTLIINDIDDRKAAYLEDIKESTGQISREIEKQLLTRITLAKSLTAFVSMKSDIDSSSFKTFASEMSQFVGEEIIAIQLVKDSTILYSQPDKGNEVAIGKNITQIDGDSTYVRLKMKAAEPMVIGPRTLLQGNLGLVYRDPIIIDNGIEPTLWGYSVMVMDLNELLKGYSTIYDWPFGLYSTNAGLDTSGYFFGSKISKSRADLIEKLNFLNREWEFRSTIDLENFYAGLYFSSQNKIDIFSLIFSLIISLSIGFSLYNHLQVIHKNQLLARKNRQIREQLAEKNTLISEVHHRIKNHFQLMNSLNNILYTDSDDEKVQNVVKEINNRVQSLAEVYNQLTDNRDNQINTEKYIKTLAQNVIRSTASNVELELQIGPNRMEMKKIGYIGVILNEMITNSLKHAFKGLEEGRIKIELKSEEVQAGYELKYFDNGNKLSSDILMRSKETKGVELISIFVEQLEGKIDFRSENGWVGYQIQFPNA